MNYEQDPPFAVQIEPVEGCTLACSFCALQSIRNNGADASTGKHGDVKGPYKMMDVDTAYRVATEISRLEWNPRIEFAMHGEPTLHPDLPRIIAYFRQALGRKGYLMVTTNGSGILKPERLLKLFDAGVSTVAIDDYKHADFASRIAPWITDFCKVNLIDLRAYPQHKDGNPHQRYPDKRVVLIHDISDNHEGTHKLTNQGGNSFEDVESLNKRCAKPFRELSVRWDGNVALCCDDWPGAYKIGNVNKTALDTIWNHERMRAARRALYHGMRALVPVCSGCNVVTYRNGLLPDKMGKQTMPKPNQKDIQLIAGAVRGPTFTRRVK